MSIAYEHQCQTWDEYHERLTEYRQHLSNIQAAAQKGIVMNLSMDIPIPPKDKLPIWSFQI